jgi:hypothetical protein
VTAMLGANKRRRACYRHLRQRCHGGGGCVRPNERETHVHDDSCCLTIGIGKLQPALSRKLPRNLAEQGIS